MKVSRIPKGFQSIASVKSPFRIDRTDLVEPQEGQGTPVTRLNKQTPGSSAREKPGNMLASARYTLLHKPLTRVHTTCFCPYRINKEVAGFFACFFHGLHP